ncbi:MAG: MFS transporter [Candidatus Freyarchaeota archaeon]
MSSERFPQGFLLLCLMGAFAIFSSTMSKSPTLSLFAQYLGANDLEIGLIAAASTVTGIFTNIIAGSLSDIYGRRRLLIASSLVFATAPFLYLPVTNTWQLTLIRIYHGVATATFMPVALASIADLFPSQRGRTMSLFSSSTMIGRLLAPTVAGFLIGISFSHFAPFQLLYLICGVSGIIALLAAVRLKVRSRRELVLKRNVISGFKSVIENHRILMTSSAEAVTYFGIGAVETFLPIYAVLLGFKSWEVGLMLSLQLLTITLSKPLMGTLSDQYGRRGPIFLGLIISAVSMIVIPFCRSFFALLALMIINGLGISSTTSSTSPLISDLSSTSSFGSAMGTLETIKDVGHASGPIAAGWLIAQFGYVGAFTAIGVVVIADSILFALAMK